MLIFNTGISFYILKGSDYPSEIQRQKQISANKMIPPEVEDIRKKNDALKQAKPYLFMSPEELSSYDCKTISDTKEKQQCADIQENYKVSLLFEGLTLAQISSFDCTKIKDKALMTKCKDYIKETKSVMENIKTPAK